MKKLRKSYILQMFTALLMLFIILLCVSEICIYIYGKRTVSEEFRRLNQASLTQLAERTGDSIENVIAFASKVSVSSRILSNVENNSENAEKEIHSILSSLQGDFSEYHTNGRQLIETSILGKNNIFASASNSKRSTWEELFSDPLIAPLLEGKTTVLILPTETTELSGIMKYAYKVIMPLRDLFTGEALGVVIINVSELQLYEHYKDYLKGDADINMVTADGIIVSSRNKKSIGSISETIPGDPVSGNTTKGQILLYEEIPGTDWYLLETVPEKTVYEPLTKLRNVVILAILVTSVLFIIATAAASQNVLVRVMRLRDKMQLVMDGDLSARIDVKGDDEFGQIEQSFNSMVSEIDHLITRTRESEHEKRIAEMDFLNAQINSHFIHNTLTSIRFMLDMGKIDDAGEMIFYFSRLLRKTLSRSDEFIPLSEEIETLHSYVMLQGFRYPNKFEAVYEIPEETSNALVPTLILQPAVENAIFHGAGHEMLHIVIRSERKGDTLKITVEDDGVGMTAKKQSTILNKDAPMNRIGLRNVHDRLQLIYGKEYGLQIDSKENIGTKIIFLLPFNLPMGEEI